MCHSCTPDIQKYQILSFCQPSFLGKILNSPLFTTFWRPLPPFNQGGAGEGSHYGRKYVCILVDPKFITEFNHIHNLPQLHRFHYRNYSKSLVWKLTVLISLCSNLLLFRNQDLWDHSFIAYTKVSKKLKFLALKYFHADMHTYLRVAGRKKC